MDDGDVREVFSVGLVKEYAYCPLYAWHLLHSKLAEGVEPTPSMEEGKKVELPRIADALNLPHPRLYEHCIIDEELGLRGCPDIVAGERRRVVMEVKKYPRDARRLGHFMAQARAYAVLVERVMGGVEQYVLVVGERVFTRRLLERDLREVEALVARLRRLSASPQPPAPRVDGRCFYCDYRRFCPALPTANARRAGLVVV